MARQVSIEDIIDLAYNKDKDLGKAIHEAVGEGLYGALHSVKRSLMDYVNGKEVDNAVKEMQERGYDISRIKSELVKGIASGLYLTKKGKEIFLKDKIKERKKHGLIYKIKHPIQTIKSYLAPKPVDNILRAAGKFYDLLKMGYEGVVSEKFKEAVFKLNAYDFLSPALHIAKEEKLKGLNYNKAIKDVNKNIIKYGKEMTSGLQEMTKEYTPAKVVSAALLLASFLLLGFSASHMTGFVIAGNKIPAGYPIGAGFILLIIALCLSLFKRKKAKNKKVKARRKKKGRR